MSAGAKPALELALIAMKRIVADRARTRRTDRKVRAAGARVAAARPATSAHPPIDAETLRLTKKGAVFAVGSDHFLVADRYASCRGPRADVVILHGSDRNDREDRCRVRAVQVRDVERLIRAGCIVSPSATDAEGDHPSTGGNGEGQATSTSIGTADNG